METARRGAARLWEVDAVRGLAVLAMFAYHFAWDWAYVNDTGFIGDHSRILSGPIAGTFITVLGVSLALDRSRMRATGRSLGRRLAQRVALLGGAAALVTLATWIALPDEFVYFGILHLLTACTLLVALTARLGAFVNALIGVAALVIGWSDLLSGAAPVAVLSILGWGAPRATVDWYPLLPWAGFAFLGFAAGSLLYPGGARRFHAPDWSAATAPVRFLGRHALPVYLLHQLVLLPLAWLIARVAG